MLSVSITITVTAIVGHVPVDTTYLSLSGLLSNSMKVVRNVNETIVAKIITVVYVDWSFLNVIIEIIIQIPFNNEVAKLVVQPIRLFNSNNVPE